MHEARRARQQAAREMDATLERIDAELAAALTAPDDGHPCVTCGGTLPENTRGRCDTCRVEVRRHPHVIAKSAIDVLYDAHSFQKDYLTSSAVRHAHGSRRSRATCHGQVRRRRGSGRPARRPSRTTSRSSAASGDSGPGDSDEPGDAGHLTIAPSRATIYTYAVLTPEQGRRA